MRIFMVTAILVLASCATSSGVPELESRLLSWTGSSIQDLAAELGEPTTVTDDSWEWRFTGPGIPSAPSSLSQPAAARCANCDLGLSAGYPSSPGIEGKSSAHSIDTSIPRKECVYRAKIDGESIVQIETFAVSGRCRFGKIPFQGKT